MLIVVMDRGARYPLTVDPTFASYGQQAELLATDGAANDALGTSMAAAGDTLVVGAPAATVNGHVGAGAAYVFTRSGTTWSQAKKLVASDAGAGDGFGYSVAIQDGTVVVGAPTASGAAGRPGAAYVFTGSGSSWSQAAKLTVATANAGDRVGQSVAVDSGTIAVGAPGGLLDQTSSGGCAAAAAGSAYVFSRPTTGWRTTSTPTARLTSSQAGNLALGYSVAVSVDTVVAGAPCADANGHGAEGRVALFAAPGGAWSSRTEATWLTAGAPGAGASAYLGESVAIQGDTIVAGAPSYINSGVDGSAYVFYRPDGDPPFSPSTTSTAHLTLAFVTDEWLTGERVGIDGGVIVVGTPEWGGTHGDGALYVYRESGTTWTSQTEFDTGEPDDLVSGANENFATGVAVSGTTIFGGSPAHSIGLHTDQGAAYAFLANSGGPTATTGAAASPRSPVTLSTYTTATANAVVNPRGHGTTDCHFDYGRTTAYAGSAACASNPGAGTADVAETGQLTGLSPGTLYHYRIVITTDHGAFVGADRQVRTYAGPQLVSPPGVLGDAKEGVKLTPTGANFSGVLQGISPFEWLRCDSQGNSCLQVSTSGPAPAGYTLGPADVGHRIRVRLTALSPIGTVTGTSPPTSVVTGSAPQTGTTVSALAASGTVLFRLPGASSSTPLSGTSAGGATAIPTGTLVDASHGTVTLAAATKTNRGIQTASIVGGRFVFTQSPSTGIATLTLSATHSSCAASDQAVAAKARKRPKPGRTLMKLRFYGKGLWTLRTRSVSVSTFRVPAKRKHRGRASAAHVGHLIDLTRMPNFFFLVQIGFVTISPSRGQFWISGAAVHPSTTVSAPHSVAVPTHVPQCVVSR